MIVAVYGTTGELIKLAPVLHRLGAGGTPVSSLCTGQQAEQIPGMLKDFGLPEPALWLARGHRGVDLERPLQVPFWFGRIAITFAGKRRPIARLLRTGGRPLVIVHGDTFTTVIGAVLGRLLRVPVAHIEAGMRSGDWRNPFPEELNRRAAAKLVHLHFAPGARAVGNLQAERVRGEIVDTGWNTIVDNVRDVASAAPAVAATLLEPDEPFGLVSLHRFELLDNRKALAEVLSVLRVSALRHTRLLFIDHPVTAAAVDSAGLGGLFDVDRFVRIPRQRYFPFLSMLKASSFLITDSGGSQEECAFMGHPCLVHRAVTEHDTGLGRSVVLSRMDIGTVRSFLEAPKRFRSDAVVPAESPSDRIVEVLRQRGFVSNQNRTRLSPVASTLDGFSTPVRRSKGSVTE